MSRFLSRTGERLHWRVTVQTDGRLDPSRATRPLAWHLVECEDPSQASAHCPEGQRMMKTGAIDPDGHCLIDGVCARCEVDTAPVLTPTAVATPPKVEEAPPSAV